MIGSKLNCHLCIGIIGIHFLSREIDMAELSLTLYVLDYSKILIINTSVSFCNLQKDPTRALKMTIRETLMEIWRYVALHFTV